MNGLRDLPLKKDLLERTRIKEMFERGLNHPLFIVKAGPGYGKTQAAASYLNTSDARLIWLKLTELDNLKTSFWNNFVTACEKEIPALAERLCKLQFPNTLPKFDLFLREFAKSVYEEKQVVLIVDDFNVVEDADVLRFFKILVEAGIENFCLLLLANSKGAIDEINSMTSKKFMMTGDDLCFTANETKELFEMHGITLRPEELDQIQRYTEGWAFPLYLLASSYKEHSDSFDISEKLVTDDTNMLFERRFFEKYPVMLQILLVKLSFLDGFPQSLLRELYLDINKNDLKYIEGNIFIVYTTQKQSYFFHNLYKTFLQEKCYLVGPKEEKKLYKKAAGHYLKTKQYLEAITYYRKCEEYGLMLESIIEFARSQEKISTDNAEFLLEQLAFLPEDQTQNNPAAEYLYATIYLNLLKIDEAEKIFVNMIEKYETSDDPELTLWTGEAYASLGGVHMMRLQEDFSDYFEKACKYIPDGTKYHPPGTLRIGNNHIFSMADNKPGAKERMTTAICNGIPFVSKAWCGSMYGMELLHMAEAAYLSNDQADARNYAYKALYKSMDYAQHDIACSAHFLLAKIALIRADSDELQQEIQAISDYAERYDIGVLREIKDTALAWYYTKMDDCIKVPRWILTIADQKLPLIASNRATIVYANYLLQMNEFSKLIAVLEHPKGLYLSEGIWHDRICLFITLAIAYQCIDNDKKAVELLWEAYDMSYHNNITLPFIEMGKYMRKMITAVQEQDVYAFDPAWLEKIQARSNTYTKKLIFMRNAYKTCKTKNETKTTHLSKREKEILSSLAQGLTREEIAGFHSISINTVKSGLNSIYSKLGAINRADAIYIATTEGILE